MNSRKLFALASVLCAALASAALAALVAEFNAGFYTQDGPGSIRQTLSLAASTGASYDVGAYTLYPATLASR